jgi:hypothetical protein
VIAASARVMGLAVARYDTDQASLTSLPIRKSRNHGRTRTDTEGKAGRKAGTTKSTKFTKEEDSNSTYSVSITIEKPLVFPFRAIRTFRGSCLGLFSLSFRVGPCFSVVPDPAAVGDCVWVRLMHDCELVRVQERPEEVLIARDW